MYWGLKSRFHDLGDVLKMNPKSVEFHLTEEDVRAGHLNGKVYPVDYSIHLPEYWTQTLINPCDTNEFKNNTCIYNMCILKGLSLRNNFKYKDLMKVILHPGGASVDREADIIKKDVLYRYLERFDIELNDFPEIELLIENMPPLPWYYGGQYYSNIFVVPEEIKDYCDKHNTKICLDISHLGLYCNYANRDLIECINILLPYTRQIHLADAEGTDGEGANIGEGNIDFEKVMKTIENVDCAVIPETMWGHKDDYAGFKQVIKECEKWLTSPKHK